MTYGPCGRHDSRDIRGALSTFFAEAQGGLTGGNTLLFAGKPMGCIIFGWPRGYSSAGRALAWHARGQRFDPAYLHHRPTRSRGASRDGARSSRSPSSRGLGHRPFTAVTGVRIPLGTPENQRVSDSLAAPAHNSAHYRATRRQNRPTCPPRRRQRLGLQLRCPLPHASMPMRHGGKFGEERRELLPPARAPFTVSTRACASDLHQVRRRWRNRTGDGYINAMAAVRAVREVV